jgi:GTP pyrophosphokinase/guanosine-3',5'-bis(diphosphate) 3'-pyrophosphohydrolase
MVAAFNDAKMKVEVSGREKTVYSIYRKMEEKHAGFAQVNDIFGFRIIVQTMPECYLALGVLHQLYKPVPGRFKDYIAIPKPNGYQSLHTTLVGRWAPRWSSRSAPRRCTRWPRPASPRTGSTRSARKPTPATWPSAWARCGCKSLLDIQDETRDAGEFLEHVKIDLFPDAVYVFTPKSKILALPKGATPVDFAYAIHSDVGDHCVAAKINGEPATLRATLNSGDVVEVVTAPAPAQPGLAELRAHRPRPLQDPALPQDPGERGNPGPGAEDAGPGPARRGLPCRPRKRRRAPVDLAVLLRWSGNRTPADLLTDVGTGKKIATIVAKRIAQLLREQGQVPDAVTLSLGRYSHDDNAPSQGLVVIDGSEGAPSRWRPAAAPSRATPSSATWAGARA